MPSIKILSIETSGDICSVGLSDEGKLIAEYTTAEKHSHDKLLASYVKNILRDNNLDLEEISSVAVSVGPGSFTGLRVGVSLAKSLCFGGNPKLIPVPTLQAFAFAVKNNGGIFAIIPSHRDLFYIQEFDKEANPLNSIELLTKESILQKELKDKNICGSALVQLPELTFNKSANSLSINLISNLANKLFKSSSFVSPSDTVPIYSQNFVPKNHKSKNSSRL